ncbi:MAG: M1 family metallopeptidase [Microscillaceae bacterium]|nr:M1 family metallopeptidase [Microscillaceae bacterium]
MRPERTCFDVRHYDLQVKIDPKNKEVSGVNHILFKVEAPTQRIQLDLYQNMKILNVLYENASLSFIRKYDAFFVDFPAPLSPGEVIKLSVFYKGNPQTLYRGFRYKGFYWNKDEKGRPWIGVTCEQVGASLWWPNKDHLSDEPDSVDLHYTVPEGLVCVANGTLEGQKLGPSGYQTWHWKVRNPIDNYNITFNLGHYVRMVEKHPINRQPRSLEYYVLDYDTTRAADYFRVTPLVLDFFEKIFGDYPFWNDKFAVIQTPYDGMEHQSCLAIGAHLKARTKDDYYYPLSVNWNSVLVHEIAHEWWGNSVSVADMADAWLQEGFATYAEALFMEHVFGKEIYQQMMNKCFDLIQWQHPLVGKRHVNVDMFKDNDIYFRGAWVLHRLREEINNDQLFFGILLYFQARFRGQTVSSDDFVKAVEEVCKRDFSDFFGRMLYTLRGF